jgi:RHS repeat-associated protein
MISAFTRFLRRRSRKSATKWSRTPGQRPRKSRRHSRLEHLEERALLAVEPISLADAALFSSTGEGASLLRREASSISADGQLVVFHSAANDLAPNDTNKASNNSAALNDVFLFNRSTGQTTLISINAAGTASGNGSSTNAKISKDGRFVLFESSASDLLTGVSGNQIYLRDLQTQATILVSASTTGNGGNGTSQKGSISADGRYLLFESTASDLVENDSNGRKDVFLRDLQVGTTQLISRNLLGDAGNGDSFDAQMSDNGRFVVFASRASDLVAGDEELLDIFVHDLQTGSTELVSVDWLGNNLPANNNVISRGRAISSDGRYVLFESEASGYVPQNTAFQGNNVYIRDRQLGTTSVVTISADGLRGTGGGAGAMTPDGRYVAFVSGETDLISGLSDTNSAWDVYLRDMHTGVTRLVSWNAAGTGTGNRASGTGQYDFDFVQGPPAISDDGRYVAFASEASNLVSLADGNDSLTGSFGTRRRDVFVRDMQANTTTLVSVNRGGTASGDSGSYTPAMSADGRVVAFESHAGDLVAGQDNLGNLGVFVREVTSGPTQLASQRTGLFPEWRLNIAGGQLEAATPDGRFVAFTSQSVIYVRDRITGQVTPESFRSNGALADVRVGSVRLSADGRFVLFASSRDCATIGPSNTTGRVQVWLRDRQSGQTRMVSVNAAGEASAANAWEWDMSLDGRFVAWSSEATDLVTGFTDGNGSAFGARDVFVRDLHTGVTRLASHVPGSAVQSGNGISFSPLVSADGSRVIFISRATDLAAGIDDANAAEDIYAYDVATGTVSAVAVNSAGNGTGDRAATDPVMSADGRYVAFASAAGNLVAGKTNTNYPDVFLRDLLSNTTTLVSINAAGTGNGGARSFEPSISADGRYVAFTSDANDLVAGDAGQRDVFVRDLLLGTTLRASGDPAGGPSSGASSSPLLSPDGGLLAFFSTASNLVSNFVDANGSHADLYVRNLTSGVTDLATVNHSGTAGTNGQIGGAEFTRIFAGDGTLFFTSRTNDLVNGDRNNSTDSFAYQFAGAGQIRGQLFDDANRNGMQDPGENGIRHWTVYLDANGNGRFDADERNVQTDAAGAYAFTGLPAGDYTIALALPDGYTRTAPAPGVHAVSLTEAVAVVAGQDFGAAPAQVDLQVSGVAAPASVDAGREFTVSWSVRNLGADAIAGDWQDAVYLSRDGVLDAGDTLVAVRPHAGGLAALGSYSAAATLVAPPSLQGTFQILVQTDRRRQVANDPNRTNNVAAGDAVQVAIPQLLVDTPHADQFTAASQQRYYQFTVAPGHSLVLALNSAAVGGSTELYLRRGRLPTPWEFDLTSRAPGEPDQTLIVPVTQSGVYYVLAASRVGEAAMAPFTVTASLPGFSIQNVSTNVGGNAGRVTIKLEGAGFTPQTLVSLVSGNTVIDAARIDFRSPSLLYATFDLAGKSIGAYDVRISDASRSSTSSGAFEVVQGNEADLDVDIQLLAPEVARNNSGVVGEFDNRPRILVTYENKGNVDVAAPVFQLTTDFGKLEIQSHTVTDENGALQFLGTSADGPAGILRPGAKGRIEARLTLPLLVFSTSATITLTGSSISKVGDEPSGITINWSERKAGARPEFIGEDAWDPIWDNFTATVGTTVDEFQAVLADNATYLSQLEEYVSDLNRLIGFELQQADASLPVPILSGSLDAAFPTPGVGLSLGRVFLQPISGRYRLGPLGRGWAHGWEVTATTDDSGHVRIVSAGAFRFFYKQANGSYRGVSGDHGVLTLDNGAYRIRELDGTVTAFRTDGKVDSVEEPHGTRVAAGYDAAGRLISLTHSTGPAISIGYNAQGRINQVTDPAGRMASYTYDAAGEHLLSVTDPQGTTEYAYVAGEGAAREHALASIKYYDGTHHFFDYDSRGRLASQQRDGGAEAITYEYDSAGGVTVTDATGAKTLLLFDEGGQIQQVRDPLGRLYSFEYDAQRNLVLYVSPTGLQWSYDRDARGNVVRTVNPMGHEIEMTYDPMFNQLTSLKDARGKTTQYHYDNKGDLRSITYPNGSQEQFSYDPLGNLTESINRRGRAIGYSYDSRGLLTRKDYADGSQTAFTYDARGNLLTATDSRGTIVMDYDSADRLTKITYPGGRFLEFTYDAGGRRTKSVDQDGFTVNYQYDAAGRLAGLTDGSDAVIVDYSYNNAGYLVRKDLGNGTFTTYEYDRAGQLLELINHAPGGAVNSFFEYTYDAEGRRTSVTTEGGVTTYGYDLIGQLTSVALPGGREIFYDYDAAGNRISVTDNGVVTNYTVNDLNQYVQVGTTFYTYDADGNLSSKTDGANTTSYTFDDESQLIGSIGPDGVWSYEYNPFGDRMAAIYDGQRTEYLIDPAGLGDVVAEYGAGGLIARYVHGFGLVTRTNTGGLTAYYDFDAIGNTVGLTNGTGAYVNRYSYLPFGETTTVAAAVPNPFGFVGEWGVMEAGAGLSFMRARHYDAAVGQFVSDDPIGLAGEDVNLRRYATNNPVSVIDPNGLWAQTTYLPNGQRYTQYFGQDAVDYANAHGKNIQYSDGATFPGDGGVVTLFPSENPSQPTRLHEYQHALDISDGVMQFIVASLALTGQLGLAQNLLELKGYGIGWITGSLLDHHKDRATSEHYLKWIIGHPFSGINSAAGAGQLNQLNLTKTIQFVGGFDPNYITGPAGFGSEHFVRAEQTLPYTIRFENDPEFATAAAQEVFVTHQLDADLDWSSVELGEFGFGPVMIDVPQGLQAYQTRVNYQNEDGSPLLVDVTASLDLATGILSWIFRSVDPLTGFLPAGVFDGFLPVNDETGVGEGFVRYFVRSKPNLSTRTTIDQQASIVFDINEPVITNTYTNTIDAEAPSSQVAALPASTAETEFTVSWAGDDGEGSGIASYDVFVSIDGGPFQLWLDDTTDASGVYSGETGRSYAFYSVATDNVGLVEAAPATADAQIAVGLSWTNADPNDVNNDGAVDIRDLLAVVQFLRDHGGFVQLPVPTLAPPPYVDANGDGAASVLDLLQLVQTLRSRFQGQGEGEESRADRPRAACDLIFSGAIDNEDDFLLDSTLFRLADELAGGSHRKQH